MDCNELNRITKKVDHLINGWDTLWKRMDRLTERVDNHISKHKEYAEGGDPCQIERSDI